MDFDVEREPDPLDVEFLETQIRREAALALNLGDGGNWSCFCWRTYSAPFRIA